MIVYTATKARFQQDVLSNDNPNPAGYGRIPRSSGFRTKRYARSVRKGVCRPERAHAMRGVSSSRNLPAIGEQAVRAGNNSTKLSSMQQVYETALEQAAKAATGQKHVLIVEGGPGTGKSVVAINLLVALTKRQLVAQYVTRNSAPRMVYEAMLTGSFKKSHITNLFSGSGAYHAAQANTYDCLIVDEAHRLNAKSGMFSHLGVNQVMELIRAARFSVFFVDEDQKVTLKDIGDKEELRRRARQQNATVTELKLQSQFRCNGSDGYLAWLDNTLEISKTANPTLDPADYDFRIMDDPAQLHALIRQKNKTKNSARMVAGYCWDWLSKKTPALKDIVLPGYQAAWNLDADGQAWIIKPDSVSEVGCIHTAQGAPSIHGWKALAKKDPAAAKLRLDAIIKNTYRTLMTRGLNPNPALRRIPRAAGRGPSAMRARPEGVYASRRAPAMRAENFSRSFQAKGCGLPVFSLQAACGNFGRGMAVEPLGWIKCPPGLKPDHNMFAAQVAGRSMEPKLQDGDYCVFRANPGGSRQNKLVLVLVQHSTIADPDTGGSYTVKKYTSKKKYAPDGAWQHEEIILQPLNPAYRPIVIPNAEDEEFMVVAEVVGKCAG